MGKKTVSVIIDDKLLEQLEAVASQNRRRRSAEINVAIEFYLKHINNIDELIEKHQEKLEEASKETKANEVPTATNEVFYNSSINLDDVPGL